MNSPEKPPVAAKAGESRRERWLIGLFVVLFAAAALVIGWQFQEAGKLEQEIAGLESELVETTALLEAHQSRLIEVRDGVRDLAAQIEGLEALVEADPADLQDAWGSSMPSMPERDRAAGVAATDENQGIPARLP